MLSVVDRQDRAQAAAEHRLWRWPSPLGRRRKDIDDLFGMVDDPDFWAGWLEKLRPVLDEAFGIIFRAGAEAGFTIEPATKDLLPLDPDAINRSFDRIVTTYTDEWWRQFQTTTQDRMRSAIRRAQTDGTGVEGVIADIEPLFGTQRAMTIAATETTRLFGLGAQAAYSAAGLDEWEWQTVEDGFVCPVCSELNKTRHAISTPFRPAHPRCRCFPRPVVAETVAPPPAPRRRRPAAGETDVTEQEPAPAPEARYPAKGFKTRAEIERWLHDKYPNIGFNMKGVNMESANALAREIDRQGQKWPEVMKALTYVGSTQTTGLGQYERYLSKIMQRKRNTIAFATTDRQAIMFNAGKFSSKVAFQEMMERGVKTGHFGQMENAARDGEAYIYAHEFGHQLDNLFGTAGAYDTVTGYARASGFGFVKDTVRQVRSKLAIEGRKVSLYGQTNTQEMWAEGYATSQWGTAPAKQNAWIQAQAKLLDELHPSKWKRVTAWIGAPAPANFVGDIKDDTLRRKANEDLYALAKRLGLPESEI